MMSKVFFLVLLGCALVLASPVQRDNEVAADDKEVGEISQQEIDEIMKEIQEEVKDLMSNVEKEMNDEAFQKALENVKKLVDELFSEPKAPKGSNE